MAQNTAHSRQRLDSSATSPTQLLRGESDRAARRRWKTWQDWDYIREDAVLIELWFNKWKK
jgi:hypothetical protein